MATASGVAMIVATTTPLSASALIACHHCAISPGGARHWQLVALPPAPGQAPLSDELLRSGKIAGSDLTELFTAKQLGSGRKGLVVEAVRHIARRRFAAEQVGVHRDKISSAALAMRLVEPLGDQDKVSIGAAGSVEKRRFAFDLANGHLSRGRSLGVEASWSHGPSWRLAAGYLDQSGSAHGPALVRGIELAEGAIRTQAGPWAALSYTIGAQTSATTLAFGIRAQALRIASGDRLALGSRSAADNRVALTASLRFR